jgi:hypothetical protein
MAFTDAEKTDIRRYCGYSMFGTVANPNFGARFSAAYGTLEYKMNNMQPTEEDVVRNTYLTNLPLLETDIISSRQNLDTMRAAVWYWNPNEIRDRERLYRTWRLKLCSFLGIPPGEGLCGDNQISIEI